MEFDHKFNQMSVLVKVLLLLIPVVNIVTEVLVRLSAVLRTKSTNSIIGLVLAFIVPIWGWVDLIAVLLTGKLFLND